MIKQQTCIVSGGRCCSVRNFLLYVKDLGMQVTFDVPMKMSLDNFIAPIYWTCVMTSVHEEIDVLKSEFPIGTLFILNGRVAFIMCRKMRMFK